MGYQTFVTSHKLPNNMLNLGGLVVFKIDSFLYKNKRYFPKSGYGFVFHPAFRALGLARRPSKLGMPGEWTHYTRKCPICKKETKCLVIAILFTRNNQNVTQQTYLDYCTNCSNILTVLEIKDNEMKKDEAAMLLTMEMKMSNIPLSGIPNTQIKTATEYQKARFEMFLNNFTSRSGPALRFFQKTLADSIEEVKEVFFPK